MALGDEYWMQRALKCAQHARDHGEVPVGAVLVDAEGSCLAEASNQPIALKDPTAHAEVLAIRQASQVLDNYRLPGTRLYVTLEPCLMCVGAMQHARIQEVIFALPDLKTGALMSCRQHESERTHPHTLKYRQGPCTEESLRLLQSFFKERR